MSQVQFGHRVVFTLLEKSAIELEWRGNDGVTTSSFFLWAPRPDVGSYRKALEAMGTSTEDVVADSYEDVVADAIRVAYYKVGHMEGNVGDRLNTEFNTHLDDQLSRYLAPLLDTRGQKFFVDLVEKGEHEFWVTVDAEKGSYNRSIVPGSYSLYWAITIKVTIVEVDTLEEAAGLTVAKALGFEGCAKDKVEQLEIPGRIKEFIMGFLALPEMEIERNDITGPANNWALDDGIDLEALVDEGDGEGDGGDGYDNEADGSEGDEDDFPMMTSSWGGQVNWLEEEEEGEGGEPDEEEERVGEAHEEEVRVGEAHEDEERVGEAQGEGEVH